MKSKKPHNSPPFTRLFGPVGLVLALAAVWGALGYKTFQTHYQPAQELEVFADNEVVPITFPPELAKPERPKNVATTETVDPDLLFDDLPEIDFTDAALPDDYGELNDLTDWTLPDNGFDDEPLNVFMVQQRPIFPGCEDEWDENKRFECFQQAMKQFVSREFRRPSNIRQQEPGGRLYVNFVIEKDGSISQIQVVGAKSEMAEKEVRRVIGQLPKMAPAKQQGRPVRTSFTLPINLAPR
jgi:periplasmic protein TonB